MDTEWVCPGGRGRTDFPAAKRFILPPWDSRRRLRVEEVSALRHSEPPLTEAVWRCCQAGAVSVPTVLLLVKETTQERGAGGFSHSTVLSSEDSWSTGQPHPSVFLTAETVKVKIPSDGG